MQCGVVCVTGIGITRMHLWFADNLDIQLQVGLRGNEYIFCLLKAKQNKTNKKKHDEPLDILVSNQVVNDSNIFKKRTPFHMCEVHLLCKFDISVLQLCFSCLFTIVQMLLHFLMHTLENILHPVPTSPTSTAMGMSLGSLTVHTLP